MLSLAELDALYTLDPCLTWQVCPLCDLNTVCLWEKGKWSYADIPCFDCEFTTITTALIANTN